MHIVAGESRILMLDAEECTTKFRRTTINDITMRPAFENFYSCAAYEKSRLRALQRIQGNLAGRLFLVWNFTNTRLYT